MNPPTAETALGLHTPGFRLSLLSRFSLERDDQTVRLRTRKEEALLAYLVLHPDMHTREGLAELFWGDTPELQARSSLRAALADLRSALGPDMLLSDRMVVQFSPGAALWVDALEFRARATAFLAQELADPSDFNPCLYSGEFLAGHYDDWVLDERERLRQLHLEALLHLVRRLRALARYNEAIAASHQALAVDPAEERAHQHLISLYAATGNRPAALRQLDICRRSLKEELDVEPSAETLALVDSIAGDEGHETEPARATNLPTPLTSFVGRQQEMAAVSEVLLYGGSPNGGSRLVTLTGAGGSGKTRLAIQVARYVAARYPHGAWWVDLSSLRDPSLLPDTALRVFGVAPAPGQPPMQALIGFLRGRTLLLTLDNCEHLTEACAHMVSTILERCPRIQVLATSRQPLGVPGEQLWQIPTFSVPVAAAHGDVEGLLRYDGVRLFVERARMHRPTFDIGAGNAAQVGEICRRLDGIPLAIELAAARVRTMELDDILARLQNRLRLLASGSALAPPRQQTLRASIDWSYNLLSPAECRLLQRLAVFVGGCTLAAAEAVCADESLPVEDVLDLLSRLVDRSLVVAENGRYRFLETVREYALERLNDAGEADALRERHGEHYLTGVKERESRLCSRDQNAALTEMATEIANIRLALESTIAMRKVARLRQVSFPLLYFYEIRGWYREGESMFRDAVARLQSFEETDPDFERSRQISLLDMETNQAYFTYRLGRPAEAYALHRRCCERLRSLGDETALRYSLRYLGRAATALGRFEEAELYLRESHALSQAAERAWDIGIDDAYLGHVAREQGAPEQAQRHYSQALEMGRSLGDPRLLAFSLNGLGFVLLSRGQPMQAIELAEQALSVAEGTDDRYDLAGAWALLGQAASHLGEPDKARRLLAKSIALLKEMGDAPELISVYTRLGHLALSMDDVREAESHFRAAASIATRYQVAVPTINALAGLASVLARKGEALSAMELVAFILRHPSSSASSRDLAQQLRPELETRLTPEQILAIELRTRSQTLEAIVPKLLAGWVTP